jgi:hypothetical protein
LTKLTITTPAESRVGGATGGIGTLEDADGHRLYLRPGPIYAAADMGRRIK